MARSFTVPWHRKGTDVPAGELERLNDERIGGDRDGLAADLYDRRITELGQNVVGEMRQEVITQQGGAHLAARAVA